MEQLSEHEIAQQRIEELQHRRSRLIIWVVLLVVLLLAALVGNIPSISCTIPLIIAGFIFASLDGIELYFASPRRAPVAETVEQEMSWLYGDDWQEQVGAPEYKRGRERVRQRGISRWHFFLHVIVFLLANVAIANLMFFENRGLFIRPSEYLLTFEIFWLALLVRHAFMAFPSSYRLMQREQRIGQAIRDEIQRNRQRETLKWKEKPKRDVLYRIGEDGELVEVEDEFTFNEDEKPKRDIL